MTMSSAMFKVEPARSGRGLRTAASTSANDTTLTILHVVAPAPFGGLETVLRSLTAGQLAQGHRAHVAAVVVPAEANHPFVQLLRSDGIPVTELALPVRAYLKERREIRDLARSIGADVIHTHGYRPDVIDSGVSRSLGIPRVTTVHGFCGSDLKGRIYEGLQIWAYRRFDGVIAVARPQIDRIREGGVSESRIHLIPNAWSASPGKNREEARQALGIGEDAFHIGWVGRLSVEKGADVFLRSIALLGDLPFLASIIGDGPEAPALRSLAAELGISDRVRWHGSLPQAGEYFPGFDALALTSRTEGTPMVLFEAMASGTPIVATQVGGVPDVITPDEGLLTPSGDSSAIAAALRAVHDAPVEAGNRANAAAHRLEDRYGATPWLDRHESLYRQLLRHSYNTLR